MLDRISLVAPGWTERHLPDVGITLVELLAYEGDHLSYYQDAVATEAYLNTARQRISVRRHVRLVDYFMHDGCNARAWLCLQWDGAEPLRLDLTTLQFLTGSGGPGSAVFEPMAAETVTLHREHNTIFFYTWGNRQCCLPRGATSATLWAGPGDSAAANPGAQLAHGPATQPPKRQTGHDQHLKKRHKPDHPGKKGAGGHDKPPPPPQVEPKNPQLCLAAGDVLIFEEVIGPKTGQRGDADRNHRHAVRLTNVSKIKDPVAEYWVYEVEWIQEDALPFTLCISSLGQPPECKPLEDVSVAHGNIVLVDHGETKYGSISGPVVSPPELECVSVGRSRERSRALPPFRPRLPWAGPLTQRSSFPSPAKIALQQADVLAGLMDRVRGVVPLLLKRIRDFHLKKDDVLQLISLLGAAAMVDLKVHYVDPDTDEVVESINLIDPTTGLPSVPRHHELQLQAIRALYEKQERLLAPKARRVDALLQHARAGYRLTEHESARSAGCSVWPSSRIWIRKTRAGWVRPVGRWPKTGCGPPCDQPANRPLRRRHGRHALGQRGLPALVLPVPARKSGGRQRPTESDGRTLRVRQKPDRTLSGPAP